MNSVDLNRKITILQKAVTKDDDFNSEEIQWIPFTEKIGANVQDILPSKSFEFVEGNLKLEKKPARIRIRHRDGVTSDMRILIHGEVDRTVEIINGPAEIGRRRWLEMMVEDFTT